MAMANGPLTDCCPYSPVGTFDKRVKERNECLVQHQV